jgi:twitching motility protein PilT
MARSKNASDLHLCGGLPPLMRIDGALEPQTTVAPSADEIESIAASLLDAGALRVLEMRGDTSLTLRDEQIGSVRIHVYRSGSGLSLAIRFLALAIPTLDALHLPSVVAALAERPRGLVVFAGPTGSGKSTTLASLIDHINRTQARHVITIEDPVEYVHKPMRSLITQREIGRDVPSYEEAIYAALRSDPDVLLVGEMRDPATIHAVLTAAETGHLVFTTLHTGDAPQTVDRIIGVFEGAAQEQIRTQLAQTLAAVVCTRLIPRSAAKGRRAAAEVLLATDAVRSAIRDGKVHQIRNIIATSRQAGMQTLEAHLSDLVARREIALDAARAASAQPGEVRGVERVNT